MHWHWHWHWHWATNADLYHLHKNINRSLTPVFPEVEILNPGSATIRPGDEILVPPKIDKKYSQFAIDMMDVIYKIAISASVALDL